MRRVDSFSAILSEHLAFSGGCCVDVGCGTGELARWLAGRGARVVGIERPAMAALARQKPAVGAERYVAGGGERLPVRSGWADAVLFLASLHHVPPPSMREALAECRRVLRPGGTAIVVEPVAEPGSYYEVTRLADEEADLRRLAEEALQAVEEIGMAPIARELFYVERSFDDYTQLVSVAVEEDGRRGVVLAQAREVTTRMAAAAGVPFDDFRFRSVCRLDVLTRLAV